MKFKKYLAELIGTFVLSMAVFFSLTSGVGLATPLVAGLTLGLFVYTVGGISGAHLNPAVTIAMASIKKLSLLDTFFYLVFQVAGGILAAMVAIRFLGDAPELTVMDNWQVGVAEAMGAAILAFGVAAVTLGKVEKNASGLVVGGSLALGAMLAGTVSIGVINPALTAMVFDGVSIENMPMVYFSYIAGPIVGAVVAAWIFRYVSSK